MSISNLSSFSGFIPPDLSSALGRKAINNILELIRDAYFELSFLNIITNDMDENDITEEWFMYIQKNWHGSGIPLIPVHEKQDKSKAKNKGRPPTIDFCFRNLWDKKTYFGIECKIIEANNKGLCDKYVKNGVNRYLEGIYSQACPQGAMAGYIRNTKGDDVANQLSPRLPSLKNGLGIQKSNRLLPLEDYYISEHYRFTDKSDFLIHHLLLFFKTP